MADKRMFSKKIIDSDAFLDMPATARLLYYDLSMRADDDGFVNSPKRIMRLVGSSQDDMNVLIARKFIIPFESGVVVIKHWFIHNYIRKDTYTETTYLDEKSMLEVKDNKAYTLKNQCVNALVDGTWTGRGRDVDVDKIRLDKNSIDKTIKKEISKERKQDRHQIPPTVEMIQTYCNERHNTVDAEKFYDFYESKNWYIGKNKMRDWQAAVRTWERKDDHKDAVTKTVHDLQDISQGMTQDEYDALERTFR